jgi:hypothetical protein
MKPRKIRISQKVKDKRGYGKYEPIKEHLQGRSESFYIGSVPHHQMLSFANAKGHADLEFANGFGKSHRDYGPMKRQDRAQESMTPYNPVEVKGSRNPSAHDPDAH